MAHVFIVDDKSFPIHLQYSFAGTGAKEYTCDFLTDEATQLQSTIERLLVGMVSDISRLRIGDDVLFYLQQSKEHEGLFFGSFKVASLPFLAPDDYLKDKLGKNLTFRVQLEPATVYPKGASERDCLDSLDGITHPSDMCWSLIYRKLKGNRGCTMITDAEFTHIMNKIKSQNSGEPYKVGPLTFDKDTCTIQTANDSRSYDGVKLPLDVANRLRSKHNHHHAYESYLQAYILQNLENLKELHVKDAPIKWIGNEVSCGVGMQSIDILFTQEDEDSVDIVVCELKDEQPQPYIQAQIKKYIEWISDYLAPTYGKKVIIHPTIVAPSPSAESLRLYNSLKEAFSSNDNLTVMPVRYIGFDIDEAIAFKEIVDE